MVLYSLVVRLYGLIIHLAAWRKPKAAQWVQGRKHWQYRLRNQLKSFPTKNRIWIHCASYGEFEQGRPLLEAIKQKHPGHTLVLSFFSPSGYEAFQDWKGAEVICYLPLDTRRNANEFLSIVNPQVAIFIKYEFWLHFLQALHTKHIPTYLVSAVFKAHHPFFKWYGSIFRNSLRTFTTLFIQDEGSAKLLTKIGMNHYEISGDTRFDRVLTVKERFEPNPAVQAYCANHKVMMAGSSWPKDEALLLEWYKALNDSGTRLVLVPHEVDEKSIQNTVALVQKFGFSYTLYSGHSHDTNAQVLIVDAMGWLSKLYPYCHVAYIGGGFDSGLHNCLEPSVYGKPVLFYNGGHHHKFNEAIDLMSIGAAKAVQSAAELQQAWNHYTSSDSVAKVTAETLDRFFQKHAGSTQKLMQAIPFGE